MASPEDGGETPDRRLILPVAAAPKTPPGKTHRRNRSDPSSDSPQRKKKRPGPLSSSSLATAGSSTATVLEDPTTPKGTRQPSPQIISHDANAHRPPAYRRPIQHGYYGDPFPYPLPPPPPPPPPPQGVRLSYPLQRVDYEGIYHGPWASEPMKIRGTRIGPMSRGLNSEYYERKLEVPHITISTEEDFDREGRRVSMSSMGGRGGEEEEEDDEEEEEEEEEDEEEGGEEGEGEEEEEEGDGEELKAKGGGKGKQKEAASGKLKPRKGLRKKNPPLSRDPPALLPPLLIGNPAPSTKSPRQSTSQFSPPPSRKTGYPYIAQTLTNHPSLALYRRFSVLNHLVLLHLQDEIAELESILAELDTAEYLANAGLGLRSRRGGNGGGAKRVQVMGAVAWKLREYNTALKNFADVADTLGDAREDEIKAYKDWLEDERPLVEAEARFIDYQADLISLRKKREEERIPPQGESAPDAAAGESADNGNAGAPHAAHDEVAGSLKEPPITNHPWAVRPDPQPPNNPLPFPGTTKLCATIISIAISGALGAWALLKRPDFQLPVAFTVGVCGGALGVVWLWL